MKPRQYFYYGFAFLLVSMAVGRVQAATVVYEHSQFVTTNTTETKTFENILPGLYQATLVDYESPDPFHVLSLSITQGTTIYGFMNGTDSFTFDVLKAGTLEAHLVAWPNDVNDQDAQHESKTGLYSVQILGLKLLPVPIPSAIWLLFSGLIGIVAVGRRDSGSGMA
jgi:hypothetical protein